LEPPSTKQHARLLHANSHSLKLLAATSAAEHIVLISDAVEIVSCIEAFLVSGTACFEIL
jgi:hypothetical protein